jgi:hypothetical protein
VGLTHDLLEIARTPLAREDLIAHRNEFEEITAASDYTWAGQARR